MQMVLIEHIRPIKKSLNEIEELVLSLLPQVYRMLLVIIILCYLLIL